MPMILSRCRKYLDLENNMDCKFKPTGKYFVPFCLEWDEWDVWEEHMRKHHPVAFFLRWTTPNWFGRKWNQIKDIKYKIKCFFKPYNKVVCKKLARTWCDRDHLMFHAMFQILVDFVELEKPWEFSASEAKLLESYDGDWDRVNTWFQIRSLYDWYKQLDPYDYDNDTDETQEMMYRLMSVRKVLWT